MLWPRDASRPVACVVVRPDAPPAVRLASQELSNRCRFLARRARGADSANIGQTLPVVTDGAQAESYAVVFEFVVASEEADATRLLPARVGAEGYAITYRREAGKVRVLCLGRDARGVYYGVQSLAQLCGVRNGDVILHPAQVVDWPGYRIRCTGNDGRIPGPETCLRAVMQLPRLKFNAWAVGESYVWPDDWRRIPDDRLRGLERACRLAKRYGVLDVVFQVHPFRGRARDKQYNIVISNARDVDAFVGLCMRMLDAGARGVLFRADDYHPLSPEDQAKFGGKAEAHIFLIRALYERMKARHPGSYLIFCPPYYQGRTARSRAGYVEYMQKLGRGVPDDVMIMWTGPVTRSLEITAADVADYENLIGRPPFLWDNTVYAHRSRFGYDSKHPGYFFDLFETRYPRDYPVTCPGIRYNWGYSDSSLSLVGNYTIADYLWNPDGYDAEASMRAALAAVYGSAAVDDLLALRDAYYTIKDALDAGRAGDPAVFGEMSAAAAELPRLVEGLARKGIGEQRIRELRGRVRRMLSGFDRVRKVMERAGTLRKSALTRIGFDDEEKAPAVVKGKWTIEREKDSVGFSFPWGTPSFAGAFGGVRVPLSLPESPTGRYYLVFSVFDDYPRSGTPPYAWPGYLRKQVLAGDRVIWDDDVEGREPPAQEALQIVDVSRFVTPDRRLELMFRGYDRQGVHNMGAHIRFAGVCIVPGPCVPDGMGVEIPDCDGVRSKDAFAIWIRFTPARIGKREALFAKSPPFEYFAYQHESGRIVAGVFTRGGEVSVRSREPAAAEREHAMLLAVRPGVVEMYLDGELQGTARFSGRVARGRGPFRIGTYGAEGPYYHGIIHEVRLFRGAVSPGEAAAEKPDVKRLSGWWRLDAPDLTIARDLAGVCPDGALYRTWKFGKAGNDR